MSYRPITDTWLLARPKSKYYGAFPAGFLLRAHALLGCSREDAVLHVCSGDIAGYRCGPGCMGNGNHWHGYGRFDVTMDIDPEVNSDYCLDARDPESFRTIAQQHQIQAVLADPPYTKGFAVNYKSGPDVFPSANTIVKNALAILPVGGRVGILSMEWPLYPKATARQIAIISVFVGNGNVVRCFAVFERTSEEHGALEPVNVDSGLGAEAELFAAEQ